ncbi:hypothetical protein [Nocardia camponoti]|uniref:Anti-sigma-M factor RsmA n=1 Tax=Nocardia camponoti TaxID=1616106 RepID=A0A917VAJ3_9NOCA|nr:hypothetical protein [Nocardia camponoti]GGK54552.1 hypothetical protein GCM10011591_27950 [Nocardia camponoti]
MSRSVPQPPFPSELLADLHGDNLDPAQREELWPLVMADADARTYLAQLDAVNAHLHALAETEPALHQMPDDVADRMFAFIDDLDLHPSAPLPSAIAEPISLAERRSRRRLGVLAAAAAVLAIVGSFGIALSVMNSSSGTATPSAAPPSVGEPSEFTSAAALSAIGKRDVHGALSDEAQLTRCVAANGIARPVIGATDFSFGGREAVLILVRGERAPTITALVVGTGCNSDHPEQLALRDIG